MGSEDVVQTVLALIYDQYGPSTGGGASTSGGTGAERWQAMQVWRHANGRITQALRALSLGQAQQVATLLWVQQDTGSYAPDRLAFLLAHLDATVPGALAPVHEELVTRARFYPCWLYLGASSETRAHLQHLLTDPAHAEERNLLLQCLAWIGDERVQATFRSMSSQPPVGGRAGAGVTMVTLSPEDAAEQAGWQLGAVDGRRNLYRPVSYALVPVAEPELTPSTHPVAVSTPLEGDCGWCGRWLVALLDVDLRDPRCTAVVGVEGTRLRIAYCRWCSSYATLYTDVDMHGGAVWSAANEDKPAILEQIGPGDEEDLPEAAPQRLALGTPRRTAFETLGGFLLSMPGLSQFGGHPEWIQDCAYPVCPKCQAKMVCVAQVSWEDIDEFAEGITYAFLCAPCGTAATTYQQT